MGIASRLLLSLCLWLAVPALSLADDAAPKPPEANTPAKPDDSKPNSAKPDSAKPDPAKADAKEQQTLERFGVQNPKCQEWSDNCAVCTRVAAGATACSLPGIACQPGTLACRRDTPAEEQKTPDSPKPPETPPAK